jgi:hypothetical protein
MRHSPKTGAEIFMAALFLTLQHWKLPKCPQMSNEWTYCALTQEITKPVNGPWWQPWFGESHRWNSEQKKLDTQEPVTRTPRVQITLWFFICFLSWVCSHYDYMLIWAECGSTRLLSQHLGGSRVWGQTELHSETLSQNKTKQSTLIYSLLLCTLFCGRILEYKEKRSLAYKDRVWAPIIWNIFLVNIAEHVCVTCIFFWKDWNGIFQIVLNCQMKCCSVYCTCSFFFKEKQLLISLRKIDYMREVGNFTRALPNCRWNLKMSIPIECVLSFGSTFLFEVSFSAMRAIKSNYQKKTEFRIKLWITMSERLNHTGKNWSMFQVTFLPLK